MYDLNIMVRSLGGFPFNMLLDGVDEGLLLLLYSLVLCLVKFKLVDSK
jgi:hypothetical protein